MSRSDDWLRVRRDERQALLDRAVEMLVADRRVAAAWLVASLGRDAADDLSDLDLWVVVEDDHMPAIAADRRAFAARIGRPVLVQEAPRNAPPGGAYLLVLYPGEAGSQQVDWYWQPRSGASIPERTRVLLDRVGVPPAFAAAPPPDQALRRATELIVIFWAMSFIAAKKIARGEVWNAVRMLSAIQLEVDEVRSILEGRWEGTPYTDRRTGALPATPREQLDWLRVTVGNMRPLMAELARRGESMSTTMVDEIEHFFDLVETMLDRPTAAERPRRS